MMSAEDVSFNPIIIRQLEFLKIISQDSFYHFKCFVHFEYDTSLFYTCIVGLLCDNRFYPNSARGYIFEIYCKMYLCTKQVYTYMYYEKGTLALHHGKVS